MQPEFEKYCSGTDQEDSTYSENGMTTISYVLATGFSLLVITWCMMFIVMSYARACVRSAAIRGSRAGAVAFVNTNDSVYAIAECNRVFASDLEAGLPLNIRKSIYSNCVISGNEIELKTTGTLRSVTTLIPAFNIDESTNRRLEVLP